MKKTKGITLIALIVTIVIMLILAGVTINMLLGEDGIISTAQEAQNTWEGAILNEQQEIQNLANELNSIINENGGTGNLTPEIRKVVATVVSSTEISVKVTTEKSEGLNIRYSIKKPAEANFTEKTTQTEKTYTFSGLGDKQSYVIKIELLSTETEVLDEKLIEVSLDEIFSEIYATTQKYTDIEGKTAWIPAGFAVGKTDKINKIDNGLVITSRIDETNHSIGNEFVWIPINKEKLDDMYIIDGNSYQLCYGEATTDIYSNIKIEPVGTVDSNTEPGPLYEAAAYREPDIIYSDANNNDFQEIMGAKDTQDFAQKIVDEYTDVYNSIVKYGGFYIGRYELTGNIEVPTVQKGQMVVTEKNWYEFKLACVQLVDNTEKTENEIVAKTTMIYGNQWEAVCSWLIDSGYYASTDSTNWGNYSNNTEEGAGEKQTAGYKESWKANNIYDFAGNCWEWTQEAYGYDRRATRGGGCKQNGNKHYAFYRSNCITRENTDPYISTRPILYIVI